MVHIQFLLINYPQSWQLELISHTVIEARITNGLRKQKARPLQMKVWGSQRASPVDGIGFGGRGSAEKGKHIFFIQVSDVGASEMHLGQSLP